MRLDHLVVTAPDLGSGTAWAEQRLGVPMGPGGAHEKMGTHNRLLNLGGGVYLEVIAVDPNGVPQLRRWFDLDDYPPMQPRLATWAIAVSDLAPFHYPRIEDMQRGALSWTIAMPPIGAVRDGGIQPALIRWPDGVHPTRRMPESGCRLRRLTVSGPGIGRFTLDDERLELVPGSQVRLTAEIETPNGVCVL